MSTFRDQIIEIVRDEIAVALKEAFAETISGLSKPQEARVRELAAETLAGEIAPQRRPRTPREAAPIVDGDSPASISVTPTSSPAPSGRGRGRGQPPSMTPAAIIQRERRERLKREAAAAQVGASAASVATGEATAAVVQAALAPPAQSATVTPEVAIPSKKTTVPDTADFSGLSI